MEEEDYAVILANGSNELPVLYSTPYYPTIMHGRALSWGVMTDKRTFI